MSTLTMYVKLCNKINFELLEGTIANTPQYEIKINNHEVNVEEVSGNQFMFMKT